MDEKKDKKKEFRMLEDKEYRKNKIKNNIIKTFMFFLVITALVLLFFLFRDQIIEVIKLAKAGDKEALREFIEAEGLKGAIIICILEAIQMVIVFMPAEIVQISAGVSYHIWFALPLCMLGVFLGATFIYIIVNVIKYEGNFSKKANNEIGELERNRNNKKKTNAQILMYILFIMPLVPFGAICYYGSGKKIPYHKYVFTCVTGVIPSIVISWAMGNITTYFIANNPKLVWLVFVCIFLGASGLLIGIGTIFKKLFLGKNVGKYTPDGVYGVLQFVAFFICRIGRRVRFNYDRTNEIKGPSIIICNHESFTDMFIVASYLRNYELTIVANAFYQRMYFGRVAKRHLKMINKKLFYTDLDTVKGMMGAVKQGRYLLLFPEGRLSTDSSYMGCVGDTAKMLKKLNAQLVFLNIEGNYFVRPKWSNKARKGIVNISVREIIEPEKLSELSVEKLAELIDEYTTVDEYKNACENGYTYKSKDYTNGLDGILYKCPNCGEELTLSTYKNHIKCNSCGYDCELNNQYMFVGENVKYNTIVEWNNYQKECIEKEIENLGEFNMCLEVKVKKLDPTRPKKDLSGYGNFIIDKNGYTFKGFLMNSKEDKQDLMFTIPFINQTGIPFGVLEKEFELYYDNFLYYFFPAEDYRISAKISLLADALYKKAINEKND